MHCWNSLLGVFICPPHATIPARCWCHGSYVDRSGPVYNVTLLQYMHICICCWIMLHRRSIHSGNIHDNDSLSLPFVDLYEQFLQFQQTCCNICTTMSNKCCSTREQSPAISEALLFNFNELLTQSDIIYL